MEGTPMHLFAAIRTVLHFFRKYRWHVAVLTLLGFVGAILEGIGINALIPLISFLMSGEPTDFISKSIAGLFGFFHVPFTFRYVLIFVVILFLGRALAQVVFGYVRGWIAADFLTAESENLLRSTFFASWPFLLKQRLGHVQTTLVRDVQNTSSLLESFGQLIQSVTGLSMYLLVAINISPFITMATLAAGAVLVLVVRPLLLRMQKMSDSMAQTEKKMSQFLSEHILGMKAVKASGAEEKALVHGARLFSYMRNLYVRKALIRALSTSLFQPFSIIFVIILFSITYYSSNFSLIAFAATLYLIQKIFVYLESGQNAINAVVDLIPYAQNVTAFKKSLAEHREERTTSQESFSFVDSIVFKNVSLNYGRAAAAIQNISFTIRHGEIVGLTGPSGAGKTSVADLLLRLFEPTEGQILIDNKPLGSISREEWRKHIGYVAQDVFLLNDTVEENIRFYYPGLSHDEVVAAAKAANIHDFISSLPEGYNTMVGDRGVLLSGGQRQRVVLARALARKPSILILDEATSALDAESEKLVQESIQALHGAITVFVIAHRLSTIENADKVMVLKGGSLVEEGSPEELRKNSTSYLSESRGTA